MPQNSSRQCVALLWTIGLGCGCAPTSWHASAAQVPSGFCWYETQGDDADVSAVGRGSAVFGSVVLATTGAVKIASAAIDPSKVAFTFRISGTPD
jgi:hypothetical protein